MKPEYPGLRPSDGNSDANRNGIQDERWVPLGDAARELKVSRAVIYRRVERGTLRSRPRGNRGLEVLLPEHPRDVTIDHYPSGQGDRNPDEQGYVTPDILRLHGELAEARTQIARLEERLAAEGAIRTAVEAKMQAAVDAITLAARAEVEAMRTQVATQITSRNAVIEELRSVLEHERTRSERLDGMLADARRPWWRRWLDHEVSR
jgi:hypothetical protein